MAATWGHALAVVLLVFGLREWYMHKETKEDRDAWRDAANQFARRVANLEKDIQRTNMLNKAKDTGRNH